MPLFYCDTYPNITIYVPSVGYDAKFRSGQFNTDLVPEDIRQAVVDQLSAATECYEDDGTLKCGHPGCGGRFPSQKGLEAHWRNEHGGPPNSAPVQASRGVRAAVAG